MKEQEFEHNMMGAEAFHNTAQAPEVSDFWAGYIRGMRRHFHGKKFGTDVLHTHWMASVESDDESRKVRGVGYRVGFAGDCIHDAVINAENRLRAMPSKRRKAVKDGLHH